MFGYVDDMLVVGLCCGVIVVVVVGCWCVGCDGIVGVDLC